MVGYCLFIKNIICFIKNLVVKLLSVVFVPILFLQNCSSVNVDNNVKKEIEELEEIRIYLVDEKIAAQADINKYISLDGSSSSKNNRMAYHTGGGLLGGFVGFSIRLLRKLFHSSML